MYMKCVQDSSEVETVWAVFQARVLGVVPDGGRRERPENLHVLELVVVRRADGHARLAPAAVLPGRQVAHDRLRRTHVLDLELLLVQHPAHAALERVNRAAQRALSDAAAA